MATGAYVARLLEAREHPEQGVRACLGVLRLAKNLDRQNQLRTRAIFRREVRNWQEAGMGRIAARAPADREEVLWPELRVCPACARPMGVRYENHRTLETL
jgi:hypothetical protein